MKDTKPADKEAQKNQNKIKFINAAQELIDQNGLENISVRKIAQSPGFHNSTIYLYFEDLDELIMLASIKYFQQYSHMLEMQSRESRSPADDFFAVWGYFLDTIMERPHLFYNFFFGKCSNDLGRYMNLYYDLFPEERKHFSADIETMYFGKNISERSLHLLYPLLPGTNRITKETVNIINEITVSCCKYKLEQKIQEESLDSNQLKKEFLTILSYITGIEY